MRLIDRLVCTVWALVSVCAAPMAAADDAFGCLTQSERTSLETMHAQSERTIADAELSPDGSELAVSISDSVWSEIDVVNTQSGKSVWRRETGAAAKELAFSPDGRQVVAAFPTSLCHSPHVERWALNDGSPLPPLEDQADLASLREDSSSSVVFSGDGKELVAATRNAVRVWTVSTGKNQRSIEPPGFETKRGIAVVEEVAVSPDGATIAGASGSGLFLWNGHTGRLLHTIAAAGASAAGAMVFSPAGKLLAVNNGGLKLYSTVTGLSTGTLGSAAGELTPVAFTSEKSLVTVGAAGVVIVDVSQPSAPRVTEHKPGVADAAFVTKDGRLLGTKANGHWRGSPNGAETLELVSLDTGKTVRELTLPGRSKANKTQH